MELIDTYFNFFTSLWSTKTGGTFNHGYITNVVSLQSLPCPLGSLTPNIDGIRRQCLLEVIMSQANFLTSKCLSVKNVFPVIVSSN